MNDQTAASPSTTSRCYLSRCDPRSRLAAFFIMLFLFAHVDRGTVPWWLAFIGVMLLPWLANMGWWEWVRPLWKLRFFFLTLFLLHGFFVPGSALLPFSHGPSQEGLMIGGQQSLRLALMATLSWVLIRVSSTAEMVMGLSGLLSPLKRVGIPVHRWAALLGWTLDCVSRLLTMASTAHDRVLSETKNHTLWDAMTSLGQRAHFFLTDMMRDMAQQEEALSRQGVMTGLPLPDPTPYRPGWRDRVLIAYPSFLLLIPLIQAAL
ncbi:MAG: energy-coupling factor transporter transmembrane protein EcfT [Magnetococcus sp. THC-1_WYH]